jgi:hypothetical protein
MRSFDLFLSSILAIMAAAFCHPARATVPFTEDFASGVSNWGDGSGVSLATFVANGGPDGSAFASSTATAFNFADDNPVVVFRGQHAFNSSSHAFEGDWLGSGINQFSAYVWHDAPVALDFFVRFATASNFPGTAADDGTQVSPHTWTKLSYDISPSNPFLFPEGPPSFFDATFTSVGNIQIGFSVPVGFGADSNTYTFGLDQPSIASVPEPASWLLAISFATGLFLRHRRTT